MKEIKRAEISVTADNLWFVERYLSVFDFLDMFPSDSIASHGSRGNPVFIHTDSGFTIESDIEGSRMQLRSRSRHRGWMRWTEAKELRAGDRIIIQRLSEREYSLTLERTEVHPS